MSNTKPNKIDNSRSYYHIYNKVVENRKLFNDQEDYEVFLSYLKDYLSPPPDPSKVKKTFSVKGRTFEGVPHQPKNYFNKIELTAYSLLPDHFHLLIKEVVKGSYEKLMRSLNTRYAIYYNKKYQRRGSIFVGPYKLKGVNNMSEVVYLTRHFHKEPIKVSEKNLDFKLFSSYRQYLGETEASWIKPKYALSFYESIENSFHKKGSYKHFVEDYSLNEEENRLLERINLESEPNRPIVETPKEEASKSFKASAPKTVLEPRTKVIPEELSKTKSRIPEFAFASSVVFILLFFVGLRNIKISSAGEEILHQASDTEDTSQVSGAKDTKEGLEDDLKYVSDKYTYEEEDYEKQMVVIKITDDSDSVNIRAEPSTESEIVGKAFDGQKFEYISIDSDWYQIKLENGDIAYIYSDYVQFADIFTDSTEIEREENN